ncbi:MAG TPA: 3'-5' exonuclease [Thermoanaerobaculia bacterium]|nr:3'-5' exonuclease [Thermoanaerobaculia bacterium]
MIDVETMSLTPRAAVASIGAVAFDPWGEEPLNQRGRVLHVRLDLGAQASREFDGETVAWWLRQSEGARQSIVIAQEPPRTALLRLADFYEANGVDTAWSYGAAFDHPVVADLWAWARSKPIEERLTLDYAIPYHRQLCARTVCFLSGVSRSRNLGIEHSAIDDALLQAEWLRLAIKALGVPRGK